MSAPDFQTADGAFVRMTELEHWRQAGAKHEEMVGEARDADNQACEAAGILIKQGYSRGEYKAAARELERWPRDDSSEDAEQPLATNYPTSYPKRRPKRRIPAAAEDR